MKRLILMRHAKSDWSGRLDDHDRPLNRRGRLAAPLMGAWLAEGGLIPDLAYVSTAARAQETWARMRLAAPMAPQPLLYHATAETALALAQDAPDDTATLLLLWHQPGIQEAANRLLADGVVETYPTAKIAVIGFDASRWSDIGFGAGRLIAAAAPKELV